ncbi:hypothetical protein GCM10010129_82600 [Streptomyces fumigatiscleroticus]|nr:hypothetical protein GCM10010129_82600 [Streptomyces fumigatiscleroticus]
MPTKSATDTIRSRYAEQAASDLADNRRQQQELTRQLEVLEQERALLQDILKLAGSPAAADPAHVPQQAQDGPGPEPAVSASAVSASARPAAPADTAVPAVPAPSPAADDVPEGERKKRVAQSTTGGTTRSTEKKGGRQVLLQDLLLELLGAHSQPRLAAELREELLRKHPDREPTPQVVRNTLEALVAKGRIQRHKQNRSVLYTVVEPEQG